MLRVLILSSSYPDAVRPMAGNFVERQALALAALPNLEVQVVAPIGLPPPPLSLRHQHRRLRDLPAEEAWNGLTVHRPRYRYLPRLPTARPFWMARRLLPLLRGVRGKFPFDVIAAQFFWPDGVAGAELAKRLKVPLSIKGRGPDVEQWTSRRAPLRLMQEASLAADGLLAVSAGLRAHLLAHGLGGDGVEIHYTGVDRSLFELRDRAADRAALRIAGPLLLSVGNLSRRKRHMMLLDALCELGEGSLLIAGDGPEAAPLAKRVRELGLQSRVRLLGTVPHERLPALYGAADVTVHAASVEGIANAWVESLACGTPVVTTASGGAGEIVTGEAGKVVGAEAAAIADAVRSVLERPPTPEAVAATVAKLSWERNATELADHLRACVRASADVGRGRAS